jgi:hypothetical protein
MICAKFSKNWPSGSGEVENVKVTDRRTTGNQNSSLALFCWIFREF